MNWKDGGKPRRSNSDVPEARFLMPAGWVRRIRARDGEVSGPQDSLIQLAAPENVCQPIKPTDSHRGKRLIIGYARTELSKTVNFAWECYARIAPNLQPKHIDAKDLESYIYIVQTPRFPPFFRKNLIFSTISSHKLHLFHFIT